MLHNFECSVMADKAIHLEALKGADGELQGDEARCLDSFVQDPFLSVSGVATVTVPKAGAGVDPVPAGGAA